MIVGAPSGPRRIACGPCSPIPRWKTLICSNVSAVSSPLVSLHLVQARPAAGTTIRVLGRDVGRRAGAVERAGVKPKAMAIPDPIREDFLGFEDAIAIVVDEQARMVKFPGDHWAAEAVERQDNIRVGLFGRQYPLNREFGSVVKRVPCACPCVDTATTAPQTSMKTRSLAIPDLPDLQDSQLSRVCIGKIKNTGRTLGQLRTRSSFTRSTLANLTHRAQCRSLLAQGDRIRPREAVQSRVVGSFEIQKLDSGLSVWQYRTMPKRKGLSKDHDLQSMPAPSWSRLSASAWTGHRLSQRSRRIRS